MSFKQDLNAWIIRVAFQFVLQTMAVNIIFIFKTIVQKFCSWWKNIFRRNNQEVWLWSSRTNESNFYNFFRAFSESNVWTVFLFNDVLCPFLPPWLCKRVCSQSLNYKQTFIFYFKQPIMSLSSDREKEWENERKRDRERKREREERSLTPFMWDDFNWG